MSDPYRGYAPVTHDTNRTAEVINELNPLGARVTSVEGVTSGLAGHAGSNGHAGIYTPSANQYYVESLNGNAGYVVQTVFSNNNTLLDLGSPVTHNGGGFNASADSYTVPGGGIYVAHAQVRITDGYGSNCNIGLSFHDNSSLGWYTGWTKYVTGSGGRLTAQYTRVASWGLGTVLRLYMYQDGPTMDVIMIFLSIWRIG